MTKEELGATLALVNACLNATSATLAILGAFAIRRGDQALHRTRMTQAFATSCIFLLTYGVRVLLTGTHRSPHTGIVKTLYLLILGSHTVLAAVVAPLVLVALIMALRGRIVTHRKLVRFALPMWVYVSVTGVIVYVMLYWIP